MTEKSLERPKIDPLVQHRRDVRRKIILPVLLPALLMIVAVIGLGLLAAYDRISSQQIGVIAACLATICVLLPLVLIMLALDAGAVLTALASGTLKGYLIKPFAILREYTDKTADITAQAAEALTAPIIAVRTQTSFVRNFIMKPLGFLNDENESKEEDDSSS
jgi:hypothetical protein